MLSLLYYAEDAHDYVKGSVHAPEVETKIVRAQFVMEGHGDCATILISSLIAVSSASVYY